MDRFTIRMTDIRTPIFPECQLNFEAHSGELTAIAGNNGAGKTTLARILAGDLKKLSGEIHMNQKLLDIHSITSAHRHGIYMLQESLSCFSGRHIMDNLLLGIEPAVFRRHIVTPSRREREAVCRSILDSLGMKHDLYHPADRLSQGEKCLIQIGRLLLCKPRIMILDECAALLTKHETARVLNLLNELKKDICILLISHKYSSVIRHCDRVAVMENGQIASVYSRRDLGEENFVRQILTFKKQFSFPKIYHPPGQLLLSAKDLCSGILHNVTFSLREGEILGIAGVVGSGRNTLVRAICKTQKITSGRLTYTPHLEREGSISILQNEPSHGLLFHDKDISFNINAANVRKSARFGLISRQQMNLHARDYMERLNIKKAACHVPVTRLSHGEQQKVLIARALHQQAKLYIFVEPSGSLDLISRSELYNIFNALLAQGSAIILISSSFSELVGVCDRILLLKSGEQAGLYPASDITGDFLYSVL